MARAFPLKALRGLLAPVAALYGALVLARSALFRLGLRRPAELARPVISVGNLSTGGTGKTPMVRALFDRLGRQGHRPAILLRGYRAGPRGSDEAAELASSLHEAGGAAPVIVADPDRARGAARALAAEPGVSVFLLDDGFQHRRVRRDLDLVLVDAMQPFRRGHLLPWGVLREPRRALRRADRIVVTRADSVDEAARHALAEDVARAAGRPPDAWCAHRWGGLRRGDGAEVGLRMLEGRRLLLFCGLGNPEAFHGTALRHQAIVQKRVFFPDHHPYSQADLRALTEQAEACGADAFLTSEKDFQRLPEAFTPPLPIYRPVLGLHWLQGQDTIDAALREAARPGIRESGNPRAREG